MAINVGAGAIQGIGKLGKVLGLPAKLLARRPEAGAQTEAGTDAANAAMAALAQIRANWSRERQDAQQAIRELSEALFNTFKNDETQAAALAAAVTRVNGLAVQLDAALETALDAVLNAPDAEQRKALIAVVASNMERVEGFISGDELMTEIDGNPIVPSMLVAQPLLARITEMHAVLADVSVASS